MNFGRKILNKMSCVPGKKFDISILVPVFNWQIGGLINELSRQIISCGLIEFVEIVVVDDFSETHFIRENQDSVKAAVDLGVACCLYSNDQNCGRSATRNRLIGYASGDYLIFLDADVMPDDDFFIKNYRDISLNSNCDVVCGGVSYQKISDFKSSEAFYLRQGSRLSVADSCIRNKNPWKWIFTANVMVRRSILKIAPFDAGFIGYGYEDIEWGMRLSHHGKIIHVNNSVTHLGLLDKCVYHKKMISSLDNLVKLVLIHPVDSMDLQVVIFAKKIRVLPIFMLRGIALIFRFIYFRCDNLFWLENLSFQLDKCFTAAEKLKRFN